MKLDSKDKQIINILQYDATLPVQAIADQVGLTNNPCWRRIKRLEDEGVIRRRAALIDWHRLGLSTLVFVALKTDNHSADWLKAFSSEVIQIPEILECHRMAGDVDYLLKLAVRDLSHYDQVYQRLVGTIDGLIDVSSTFSMEELKTSEFIDATTI